jgi:hypothetical protein
MLSTDRPFTFVISGPTQDNSGPTQDAIQKITSHISARIHPFDELMTGA